MPNPKRKHSKTRTATRRAQYLRSLSSRTPQVTECPNCGNPQQLHRACPSCGHYRGRQIVERKEEA